MPPSALDQLTRLNIVYPMLFKLTNKRIEKTTHCGVLEFVADEGKIYIPYWMMQNLMLDTGGLVTVESATLPVATYSKFQPLSKDFLDLTNPKAVLEMRLRHFACLSKGDIVAINYNNKIYELNVMETKPANAVTIIECDMNVDFEAPPGYQEPSRPREEPMEEEEPELDISQMLPEETGFQAFGGSGNRLDGKKKRTNSETEVQERQLKEYTRGIPDYNFEVGNIRFIRAKKPGSKAEKENEETFKAFEGKGQSLRQAKAKK